MPLPPYYLESYYDGLGDPYGYCVDEWVRGPSGALCIFHQRSWMFPPMLFIITREVTTLEPKNGPTFADHRVFIVGGD